MGEKEVPVSGIALKEEEACAWVVRLSSDQRTQQDELRFQQWLEQDDTNAAVFEDCLAMWSDLGALRNSNEARARLGHLYDTNPAVEDARPTRFSRRLFLGGAAALAATLAGVLVAPQLLSNDASTYATAKGEQRRVVLADGSAIMLDTATKVDVMLTGDERRIRLERGQAFFDVAHDPQRPFRVFAGSDEIRALGTAFQVRYEDGHAKVVLEEGRVAVFRGLPKNSVSPATSAGEPAAKPQLILRPGQAAQLAATTKVSAVDLSETGAWRDGEMVFDDVSMAEAVGEVNRYGGPTIVLADASLSKLRVSGTFHTNSPQAFVEGVSAALPLRVQESSPDRIVLARD